MALSQAAEAASPTQAPLCCEQCCWPPNRHPAGAQRNNQPVCSRIASCRETGAWLLPGEAHSTSTDADHACLCASMWRCELNQAAWVCQLVLPAQRGVVKACRPAGDQQGEVRISTTHLLVVKPSTVASRAPKVPLAFQGGWSAAGPGSTAVVGAGASAGAGWPLVALGADPAAAAPGDAVGAAPPTGLAGSSLLCGSSALLVTAAPG
jgi:hypothetical protein